MPLHTDARSLVVDAVVGLDVFERHCLFRIFDQPQISKDQIFRRKLFYVIDRLIGPDRPAFVGTVENTQPKR